MDSFLSNLPAFVEVAKHKSFTQAAENLDMYSSTLSRRIAALEKEIGVSLLLRNTRNVELTEAGRLLLERSVFILEEVKNTREAVVNNMLNPTGPVRVSMFEDIYNAVLRGVFSDFASMWPGIQLHINFNEWPVDLVTEPYDVDFRNGPLPDSSLKARKVITFETYLYAAPKLLEAYQTPLHPDELGTMPYINLNRVGPLLDLYRGTEHVNVQMRPVHSFGSISLVQEFTVAGHGVSMLRSHTAYHDEQAGRLIRLLPEWTGRKHDVFMVMAPGRMLRRVRIFVDYMAEFFTGLP
ncbi:MAG: LysR family transcriptional regulator [Desulfobacteraceae bacterium]|jgi:DNA-binding transcriptional LysR family regulator